jgi:hypothetical protein
VLPDKGDFFVLLASNLQFIVGRLDKGRNPEHVSATGDPHRTEEAEERMTIDHSEPTGTLTWFIRWTRRRGDPDRHERDAVT